MVTAGLAGSEWPETVVLDSTWFEVRNTWDGTKSRAFNVLGVYGYPSDGVGRTWALHASPQARQGDWRRLMASLAGEPKLVVCDDDHTIQGAAGKVWPTAEVKLCEHHLRVGVIKQMEKYGLTTFKSPEMELLNNAFHGAGDWDRFRRAVKGIEVEAWIEAHDTQVRQQAKRRRFLPDHHSTGALDEVLAKVREFMAPRAFCYRNAERTNRMLELVRLRLNRADDPDANDGRLQAQGSIRDRRGQYSLRI